MSISMSLSKLSARRFRGSEEASGEASAAFPVDSVIVTVVVVVMTAGASGGWAAAGGECGGERFIATLKSVIIHGGPNNSLPDNSHYRCNGTYHLRFWHARQARSSKG